VERFAEAPKQHEQESRQATLARDVSPTTSALPLVLKLQQQVGNQAVQQLLRSGFLQAKLAISNPDDPEEREADQVAHTIMRSPAGFPASHCSCAVGEEMCEECQQKRSAPTIQRRASTPSVPAHVPRILSDVLRSPGLPLDSATRAFFEPLFGVSLSDVRVHTDESAEQSARYLGANAYTVGHDVVFGEGRFAPSASEGRRLIAHELTHVVQQSGGSSRHQIQRDVPKPASQGSTSKSAGTGPAPMSEDINKLGPDGIPHAAQRVRDKADTFYAQAANGLTVFQETQQLKDVEEPSWVKELIIAIAGLALGGFVSKLVSIEEGEDLVRNAVKEGWAKGVEAAVDELTKHSFADTLPEKALPIVAFAEGQRQILLKLKDQERDQFDNWTSPHLHREAKEHPDLVPDILAKLQQMLVDYDAAAKTAGKDQFQRTLDAWNVYMAKVALVPAKKRLNLETPLAEAVNDPALLDFPPGVLRIECWVKPDLKTFIPNSWYFVIGGLNESLRSSFRGRAVKDVHVPQVAIINLTLPDWGVKDTMTSLSFVIGRNEAGGFFLNASSDIRWALFELALPNWKQVAEDVHAGKVRPRPMERDMWEGVRILMEQSIGSKLIDEVEENPFKGW
jgi:Domain of unknown function (DUF4157)